MGYFWPVLASFQLSTSLFIGLSGFLLLSDLFFFDVIASIKSKERWLHLRKSVPSRYTRFSGIHRITQIIVMC